MPLRKFKVIFFGLGSAGQRHLRNLQNKKANLEIYSFKKTKKNFLINKNLEKINQDIFKKYKIKNLKTKKEIKFLKPDIAFICNPSTEHMTYAFFCAKLGCNLFIEKPISNNLKDAKKLHELVLKKKLILSVGYQLLFHPLLIKLKKIIKSKTYGNLHSGRLLMSENVKKYRNYKDLLITKNKKGGGVLLEQSHDLNYLIWLIETDPTIVSSTLLRHSNLNFDRKTEDTSLITLLFKKKNKNFFFNIQLISGEMQKKKSIVMVFTKATVELDFLKNIITIDNSKKKYVIKSKIKRNDLFKLEVKDFFKKIKNKQIIDKKNNFAILTLKNILKAKNSKIINL